MRLIKIMSLIALSGSISFQSFAQSSSGWYPSPAVTQSGGIPVQPLRCPTIGKDSSQMISALQSLQDKISKDANCNALSEELKKMGELGSSRRTQFLQTIEKAQSGQALSDQESKILTSYAEDVTMKAAGLATLLTNSAQCFGDQDLSTSLFAVSSFVNEASTMLSTVAGPWGPALAVGGKVVSGLITGVNRFIQSLPGYDFKDKKDWQGYVETLCMFHEQQDEIQALIHPEQVISDLRVLNNKVDGTIRHILDSNPDGNRVMSAFRAQDDALLENEVNSVREGLPMVRLLTAQKWILDRIDSIQKDASDPMINATGQALVQKMRDEIEDFLVARQGYKFIDFQNKQAQRAMGDFSQVVYDTGTRVYQQIQYLKPELIQGDNPFPYMLPTEEEVIKKLLELDASQFSQELDIPSQQIYGSLVFFKRELAKKWDAVTLTYAVKVNFCSFFKESGYLNNDIRSSCTSGRASSVEESLKHYAQLGAGLSVPAYLKANKRSQGANWTEALNTWLTLQ